MSISVRRQAGGVGLFQLGIETYREISEYHFNYGASQEVDHGRVWVVFLGLWALYIRFGGTPNE